jgi:hypothetical protein
MERMPFGMLTSLGLGGLILL